MWAALVGGFAATAATPALAASQIYEYRIVHPVYGDIGTYTNVVEKKAGDVTDVQTKLDVAVKVLGVVLYSEAAVRSEHWQGGRLISFHSVTDTNDQKVEVRGEANGNSFVVTSPSGTVVGPADVHPSNPWSINVLNTNMMMSAKSGKLYTVQLRSREVEDARADESGRKVRQYEIDSDTRQFVWLDDHGVPVAFRTEEGEAAIDFLLIRYPSGEPGLWLDAPPGVSAAAASSPRLVAGQAFQASFGH
ncbi:MAG TPA: DUF6134 family protein [Alphaproteobacteria bacterium]|nr:DUF6134 family protein [Alphaproteobacteria bacterium]